MHLVTFGGLAFAAAPGKVMVPRPASEQVVAAAAAVGHPELAGEPPEAVFAPGDGLGPYRRLLAASRERLAPDGALVIQFRRRALAAGRDELDALAARVPGFFAAAA